MVVFRGLLLLVLAVAFVQAGVIKNTPENGMSFVRRCR